MKTHFSNGDRILQSVISNDKLSQWGEYNPSGDETVQDALYSSNPVVKAVAMIIDGQENGRTQKEIYTQVTQYLTQTL